MGAGQLRADGRAPAQEALVSAVPSTIPPQDVPGRFFNVFARPEVARAMAHTWGEAVWTDSDAFRREATANGHAVSALVLAREVSALRRPPWRRR